MQNMSGGKTALGLDENLGGALSYINICLPIGLVLSIIILVMEKTNKTVRFHALQSLLLLGIVIVLSVVVGIFVGIVGAVTGSAALTGILSMLTWVVVLGYYVVAVILAVKAYGNSKMSLPVIGGMAEKWA
jgi:uncharacterized membrane protein